MRESPSLRRCNGDLESTLSKMIHAQIKEYSERTAWRNFFGNLHTAACPGHCTSEHCTTRDLCHIMFTQVVRLIWPLRESYFFEEVKELPVSLQSLAMMDLNGNIIICVGNCLLMRISRPPVHSSAVSTSPVNHIC